MTDFFKIRHKQLTDIQNKYGAPGHNAISEITSNIFITNIENLLNVKVIQDYGITVIICLVDVPIPKKYIKLGFNTLSLSHVDDERELILNTLYSMYDEIYKYICLQKKILICCRTGTSLSPTIVISYLIRRNYLMRLDQCRNITKYKNRQAAIKALAKLDYSDLPDIFKFVLQSRKCMKINSGFISALIVYETKIKQSISNNISVISELKNSQKLPDIKKIDKPNKVIIKYDTLADVRRFNISEII